MKNKLPQRNQWKINFVLFLVFSLFFTFNSTPAFAQSLITPTIYCVGGSGVPPCAPFPSSGVSVVPSVVVSPSTPSTSQAPSTQPSTTTSTAPVPSVDPCATGNTSAFNNGGRHHRKWGRGGGGGFFEQFFQFLIKLIQQLLGGGTIPGLPTPTQPEPCPGTSVAPSVAPSTSPSTGPGTSTAPSSAPSTVPSTAPSSAPSTAPSAAPSQPAGGSSPSGEAMPSGDLTGWKLIFSDDFTQNVAIGGWPGSYSGKWSQYDDGTPDTAGQGGSPSEYFPSKVVSVNGGLLDLYLHSEGGKSMAAALLPNTGKGQTYGKYTVRFKSDSLQGFKTAWLLWPDSENWPQDGEIDFPEGDLDSTIGGFMHRQNGTSGSDQDGFSTSTTYTGWHTASTEWGPNDLKLILDGKVIGESTSRVPNTSMHYVLQTESCLGGCPGASVAGHLQVDWFVMYAKQ